jgi:hypothetical protein
MNAGRPHLSNVSIAIRTLLNREVAVKLDHYITI